MSKRHKADTGWKRDENRDKSCTSSSFSIISFQLVIYMESLPQERDLRWSLFKVSARYNRFIEKKTTKCAIVFLSVSVAGKGEDCEQNVRHCSKISKYKFRLKTFFRAECYPCIVLKAVGKNRKLKCPVDLYRSRQSKYSSP